MQIAHRAADDQLRAAGHEALLRAARAFVGDGRGALRVELIARGLCDLSDVERDAFARIAGFDCCAAARS